MRTVGIRASSIVLACCTLAVAFAPRSAVPRLHQAQLHRMSMMSEPGPQPAPAPAEPAKKPPPVVPLPTVGEGKDQMDVISKLFKNRILLLGSKDQMDVISKLFKNR